MKLSKEQYIELTSKEEELLNLVPSTREELENQWKCLLEISKQNPEAFHHKPNTCISLPDIETIFEHKEKMSQEILDVKNKWDIKKLRLQTSNVDEITGGNVVN